MQLRVLLENEYGPVFEPDDIPKLEAAYEAALRKLGEVDRKGAKAFRSASCRLMMRSSRSAFNFASSLSPPGLCARAAGG